MVISGYHEIHCYLQRDDIKVSWRFNAIKDNRRYGATSAYNGKIHLSSAIVYFDDEIVNYKLRWSS